MWLFLAFLLVPLIEIALFIQVGGLIGLWPTLGVVVLTAAAGTWLVRSQGRRALMRLRGSLTTLRDPSEPLAHGALILFSGALLLTPGFLTDAVGFALLVPGVRAALIRRAARRVSLSRVVMGDPAGRGADGPVPPRAAGPETIDAEWTEVPPGRGPSEGDATGRGAGRGSSGWTRP